MAALSSIFEPAGLAFEIRSFRRWADDLDLQRMPAGQFICPFTQVEDHQAAHLQLGFVQTLGSYDALPFSCERYALVADGPLEVAARAAGQAIGFLLGLRVVSRDQGERLMAPHAGGLELSHDECRLLRLYAAAFGGSGPCERHQPLVLPVWGLARAGDEPTDAAGFCSYLENVSTLWEPAAISFLPHVGGSSTAETSQRRSGAML